MENTCHRVHHPVLSQPTDLRL